MLLRKDTSTEVKMIIVGYEFPQSFNNVDDANWLNVQFKVKHPKGDWEKIDSCLETFELKLLIDWLENIKLGNEIESNLYFIEPCLEFEKVENNTLRVYFSHEILPSWQKRGERVFIDFEIEEKDFERVISELKEDLEKFSIRELKK